MARLGIDFGTTNTVVTIHDRGLFSIVHHKAKTRAGTVIQEVFPSAILTEKSSGRKWFGLEADRRFAQLGPSAKYVFIPSLKRQLRNYAEGRKVAAGDRGGDGTKRRGSAPEPAIEPGELLTGFLRVLAESIRESRSFAPDEPMETVITWPANANGAQRHITRQAFREAGFQVINTLNEPTASAIELADCFTAGPSKKKAEPAAVAVFDLGGGTFDASVVWIDGQDFHVRASAGIENLGGDDFDHVLLDMFLDKLRLPPDAISPLTRHALLRQVRAQKETISTGAVKSLFLNPRDFSLKGRASSLPVHRYCERIEPMLVPAIKTLREVIASASVKQAGVDQSNRLTIYLVGGSSKLPLVTRMVSAAFPESRVVLTDKPFRSVAMGAAICATDRISFRDVFARHFGLMRLRDHGRAETFDTIFPAGTPVPRRGETPLEKVTRYHPAHNIGHLRYLECASVGPNGMPADGVRTWSDILFPYDPGRPLSAQLSPTDVVATDRFADQPVCEVYRCDHDGVISVELHRPACDDSRCYEIYRD